MTRDSDKKENEAEVKIEANKEAKLKAERANLRRLFTVEANSFDDIHRSMNREKNIDIQFSKIYEKAELLFKVDQENKEIINFSDEEYETMESYRDRFIEIRVIYKKNYNKHDESKSEISSEIAPDNLKQLPKLSLKGYPPYKGNYLKVIDHLKSRFGRKDLLIEVYIRDLLALVNNKSYIKLTDLYDKLGSYLRALETLGVTTSNYAMLYPVVETCLPLEILKAWDRYRLNREVKVEDPVLTKENVLENLMSFLRHEVEGEEHRALTETAFGSGIKWKDSQKQVQKDEPTAATLFGNTSAGKICCVFCDCSHPSQDCQQLSSLNYEDRKSQVMRKRCCLVCLKPGHMAKKCHSNVKCLICERRQYALLCPDLRKDTNSCSKGKVADEEQKSTKVLLTNLPSEHEIYLKTITVRLRDKGKELCVRALKDDGSHRSYMEKSLAAELNLSPSRKEILSQALFGGEISPAAEHGKFTVTVESLDGKYSTSVSLLDQPKICSILPRIRDENLLAELASRGIKLTDVGRDTPPIRILLGADVLGRILTGCRNFIQLDNFRIRKKKASS
ncbi:transposable element Tc1 transposase [Trichonephila clavata]|uniref:Transposable element Tc1 transposase n=1 Tax=Trichonephila clavata TaxID=2740835 RepID=A0A8X6LQ37_TRICU|nr:transposable element Tc1 transposase [Trichonephila clavata]